MNQRRGVPSLRIVAICLLLSVLGCAGGMDRPPNPTPTTGAKIAAPIDSERTDQSDVATAEPTPETVEMPCPKLSSDYETSDIDDDWREWAVQKHVENLGASSGGYDVSGRGARSSSDNDNLSDITLSVAKRPPEGVCWPGTNGIHIGLKNLSSGDCAVVNYTFVSASGLVGDCFTPTPVPVR